MFMIFDCLGFVILYFVDYFVCLFRSRCVFFWWLLGLYECFLYVGGVCGDFRVYKFALVIG